MQIKNTDTQYGAVAIFFHWFMALLLIGMVCLGLYMTGLPNTLWKLKLYGWHKEVGVLILMLVTVRVCWRIINLNPELNDSPRWELFAARFVHWLFYGFMFALPITGWLISSYADVPVSFFGLFVLPTLVTPSKTMQDFFENIHTWLAYGLIATFSLHVVAALYHHFIKKDNVMRRML